MVMETLDVVEDVHEPTIHNDKSTEENDTPLCDVWFNHSTDGKPLGAEKYATDEIRDGTIHAECDPVEQPMKELTERVCQHFLYHFPVAQCSSLYLTVVDAHGFSSLSDL